MLSSNAPTPTAQIPTARTGGIRLGTLPAAASMRTGSSRALTRSCLPGPVRASAGLPKAEFAVFLVLVPLLSLPVLLATMGGALAVWVTLALTTLVAWLCAARRVVIGTGWVADRRLWHYRVTLGTHLRSVDLLDTAHGGVLRLTPHHGRAHRLRRAEFTRPEALAALRTVVASGTSSVGNSARVALAPPAHPAA